MVDGSFRRRRFRPLGLLRSAARFGRDSRGFRELTGSLGAIWVMEGPLARSMDQASELALEPHQLAVDLIDDRQRDLNPLQGGGRRRERAKERAPVGPQQL